MKHILTAALAATATATPRRISISLPGNTETSGWDNLKASNTYWSANGYPTAYPGAAAGPRRSPRTRWARREAPSS